MRMRTLVGCVVIATAIVAGDAQAAAISCRTVTVPAAIVDGGPRDQQLSGQLCRPALSNPRTVQLLVHGATYNKRYWDWPDRYPYYSYVRAAVGAGYATFAVDQLGAGASSHPPSSAVTLTSAATAIHEVVTQLRSGAVGGGAFRRVLWVGHSMGSFTAWTYAARYDDIDGYLLTGLLHTIRPTAADFWANSIGPAGGALDAGYLTTLPGTRDELFYHRPTTENTVVATDEATKDAVSAGVLGEAAATPPPESALSRVIHVPTLVVLGDKDFLWCGPPDGPQCTQANVLAAEAPYYSPSAGLEVRITPDTGHNLNLHLTAPWSYATMLSWAARRVPPA
ncbi:MAG: hypothetical protein V7607_2501 [Solirubrobacteraceae bacterium]